MYKLFILFALSISFHSFAGMRRGHCVGFKGADKIEFHGELQSVRDLENGEGTVTLNGRMIARFDGRGLDYSLLRKSFSVKNDHGDLIAGYATNVSQKKGKITQLRVPAFGVALKDIDISCVTSKER